MPRLTPEEVAAILDEHDEDRREAREEARTLSDAAQREREEQEALVEDLLAPDPDGGPPIPVVHGTVHRAPPPTEGLRQALRRTTREPEPDDLAAEYDSFDALIEEEPRLRRPGRPVARHSAMREAFHANYGSARDNLLRVLRRMADEPINFPERFSTDPPPVNSLWVNRELPSLQVQVTRTTADTFSVRPIGEHRVDLPRVVQIPREVFYAWFRLSGSHLMEPVEEDTVFRDAVKKISLKHRAAPEPPARSAWDRLLADDDEDEAL